MEEVKVRILAAYIFAFFLAPTLGVVLGLIPSLLVISLGKVFKMIGFFAFLAAVCVSFFVGWCGFKIFDWMDVARSPWMLVLLGIGFLLNDGRRMKAAGLLYMAAQQQPAAEELPRAEQSYALEQGGMFGHLGGLAAAWYWIM